MRRRHLPLLAVGAWCALAAAQTSVNFEAGAGYAAGQPLGGQQGWSEYINNGATMTVYSGDNGPSGAGSQCVELRTVSGAGEMGVELQFPDAVANGGRLITIRYDYRRVVTDTAAQCAIRLLSPNTQHWWDHWNQYVGYLDHEGNGGSWSGREWPVQDDQWHTIEWQFVWGDKYAGENGYLVYDSFDGLKKTDHARCYMHPNYTDDVSFVRLWILDAYWNLDYRDVIRIDNLVVSGAPLPSRIPVADAGADQSLPGNWEGVPVTLDASASHDPDGQITRYVWRYQLEVLYDGPQARPTVMLDPAVRYDLLLQVFDDTGLMDSDKCIVDIAPPPPINDNVIGPWGIVFGDTRGTSATAALPVLVDEQKPFKILNQRRLGYWDGGFPAGGDAAFNFQFDKRGNLYWLAAERLYSFSPALNFRYVGKDAGGAEVKVDGRDTNALIVGKRYVYIVGNFDFGSGWVPGVAAFNRGGVMQWHLDIPNEPWQWRPKMTLYEDKLYIVGEVGTTLMDYAHVYQVNATSGALEGDSHVFVELYRQWYDDPNTWWVDGPVGDQGTLALVPNAFGAGLHGLYWCQESNVAVDYYADAVAIKLDPAAATATAVWGAGSQIDGPHNWASAIVYSARTNVLYTPSHNDWGASLYAWKTNAPNGQQLAGSDLGGDHGHRQVQALDEFEAGVTRLYVAGTEGQLWTYKDTSGNGTAFEHELRVYNTRSEFFGPAACLLYDDVNDRPVLITAHRGDRAQVLAIDPTEPVVTPDDAGLYIDDVEILAGPSLDPNSWTSIYTYDFENLQVGLLNGQGGWIAYSHEYDPDNRVPTQVTDQLPAGRTGKAVLQDPFGPEGTTWFEGWPFPRPVDPTDPTSPAYNQPFIIVRWWQYRGDTLDNLRIYASYLPHMGHAFGNDADGKFYAWEREGPTAPQTAGQWQRVERIFHYDPAWVDLWVRIWVDGIEDDPNAAPYTLTNTPYLDYLDFTVDATPLSAQSQPIIQAFEACYDFAQYPNFSFPVILSVGPDGTVYYVQHGADWNARLTRLGVETEPPPCPGDCDCNGMVDFNDINPFVTVLSGGTPCRFENCDVNGDGHIDFNDINPFVAVLTAGGGPCP